MRRVFVKNSGGDQTVEKHALLLLSVNNIGSVTLTDDFTQKTTQFDAVTDFRHFEDVFNFYGTNMKNRRFEK